MHPERYVNRVFAGVFFCFCRRNAGLCADFCGRQVKAEEDRCLLGIHYRLDLHKEMREK